MVGTFIYANENIMKLESVNVARFLVRTRFAMDLNKTFNVKINKNTFRIKIIEYSHALVHISLKHNDQLSYKMKESSNFDSKWGDENFEGRDEWKLKGNEGKPEDVKSTYSNLE